MFNRYMLPEKKILFRVRFPNGFTAVELLAALIIFSILSAIAVVGIAEKGQCNIRLELSGKGGHASTPPSKGTLYQLAKAIENIEKSPFPYQITAPVHQMLPRYVRSAS